MVAIILNPNGTTYESIAFACEYKKNIFGHIYKSWYYVLDQTNTTIIRLSEYSEGTSFIHPQVFITHGVYFENATWKKEKHIEGYDWFIKNEQAIKAVKKCCFFNPPFVQKCTEFNSKALNFYKELGFKEIKCQRDANDLLLFARCFHDARIADYYAEDNKLILNICGVWGLKTIRMVFEGNITSHFSDKDIYTDYFESASLFISDDGQICFVSFGGFDKKENVVGDDLNFFFADKLSFDYVFDFDWKEGSVLRS